MHPLQISLGENPPRDPSLICDYYQAESCFLQGSQFWTYAIIKMQLLRP